MVNAKLHFLFCFITQIPIGDECHPYLELCIEQNWENFEDDHIAFCQNHTFWSTKSGRKNWKGKEYPLCTGNFLGFPSFLKPGKGVKFLQNYENWPHSFSALVRKEVKINVENMLKQIARVHKKIRKSLCLVGCDSL